MDPTTPAFRSGRPADRPFQADVMARLLSVNVGLPRDIAWRGMTVHTGIWKAPAPGRCRVRRLNIDGDGQGDLAGHGGEHRAVFVYQIESYRYWQERLGRTDFVYGQFGENFTVEGLPDDAVCIGDRYADRQRRVRGHRAEGHLLSRRHSHERAPHAGAADVQRAARILLPCPRGRRGRRRRRDREGRRRARRGCRSPRSTRCSIRPSIRAIGWNARRRSRRSRPAGGRRSSRCWAAGRTAMRDSRRHRPRRPAAPGFRPLTVTAIDQRIGRRRVADDAGPRRRAAAGGAAGPVRRAAPSTGVGGAPLFRSYSLSGPVSTGPLSDQREDRAERRGGRVHEGPRAGRRSSRGQRAARDASSCEPGEGPVALVSAGSGRRPSLRCSTPCRRRARRVRCCGCTRARDGRHFPFAAEVRRLVSSLAHGRSHVCFSRPGAADRLGTDFDAAGHLSRAAFDDRRPDAGRRRLSLRAGPLHGGHEGGADGARRQAGSRSRRDLQRRRIVMPGVVGVGEEDSASAAGRSRNRRPRLVRAQRRNRPLESVGLSERAGTGGGVRRPGPLGVPDRRLPHLRKRSRLGKGRRTSLSRSTCRRRATCSSAVRVRSATSWSIFDGQASPAGDLASVGNLAAGDTPVGSRPERSVTIAVWTATGMSLR